MKKEKEEQNAQPNTATPHVAPCNVPLGVFNEEEEALIAKHAEEAALAQELTKSPLHTKKQKRSGRFSRFVESRWCWALLAFLLPVVLMFLVFALMGTYPFGNQSCMALDLNGQYVYYYEKFRDILTSGGSMLYAWERTLGGEFLGIFLYYLSSPFTFLVLLFPKTKMLFAVWAIMLAKMGACGVTFRYYLSKSRPGKPVPMLIFSVLYAMCAYGVQQIINPMWIDAMYLLPLVLLGMEQLILKRKFVLYTVTLSLTFITNYYIGYMVAIFCVLYFFYYTFSKGSDGKAKLFFARFARFAIFSLIAALIACMAFVPAYYSLTFGKTTFQNTDYSIVARFNFLDFVTKLLPASYDTCRPEGLPVIYSGMLTLLLLPLYFFASKVKNREKILGGILLFAMVTSMYINPVDLVWHGFSQPNWLNYRYSFVFCFLLVVFAWEAFRHIESIPFRSLGLSAVGIGILIAIVQNNKYDYLGDLSVIWVSYALLVGLLVLLYLYRVKEKRQWLLSVVLLFAVCGELGYSSVMDMRKLSSDVGFGTYSGYTDYFSKTREATDKILENDDSFYRAETIAHRKVNDPMTLNINGLSHSTSTLNSSAIHLLARLGYSSASHWSKYLGETPVADSLLGVKYIVGDSTQEKDSPLGVDLATYAQLYKEVGQTDRGLVTYENPYSLGLICSMSNNITDYSNKYSNCFDRMNAIVTMMLGAEDTVELFKLLPAASENYNTSVVYNEGQIGYRIIDDTAPGGVTFTVKAKEDAPVYCYFYPKKYLESDLTLNDKEWGNIFGSDSTHLFSLGSYSAGDTITFDMQTGDDGVFYFRNTEKYFYYLDTDLFRAVMTKLQSGTMEIASHDDTHIAGTVHTDENHNFIYTSIPYDKGWKVTIDGKKVATVETLDALIGIDASDLSDGSHDIELHYFPTVYWYGIFGTVLGILLFALTIFLDRRKKKKEELHESEKSENPDNSNTTDGTDGADTALTAALPGVQSTAAPDEQTVPLSPKP